MGGWHIYVHIRYLILLAKATLIVASHHFGVFGFATVMVLLVSYLFSARDAARLQVWMTWAMGDARGQHGDDSEEIPLCCWLQHHFLWWPWVTWPLSWWIHLWNRGGTYWVCLSSCQPALLCHFDHRGSHSTSSLCHVLWWSGERCPGMTGE